MELILLDIMDIKPFQVVRTVKDGRKGHVGTM